MENQRLLYTIENEKKNSPIVKCFFIGLVVYLFYYSYRYIFQYNSQMTSPTYSDTPFMFQLMKYLLLVFIILGMSICFIISNKKAKITSTSILLLVFMILQAYQFLMSRSTIMLTMLIAFIPCFLLITYDEKINISSLDKLMMIFMYFTIIYEFVQIFLYLFTGRLPALAYDTGIITDVRFGGSLDDPNGFSIIIAFYIPYVYKKFSGFKKWFHVFTLLIMLVLTWSVTGIVSFFVVWFIYRCYYSKHNGKKIWPYLLCFVIIISVGCAVLFGTSSGRTFINKKMGSALDHFKSYDFSNMTLKSFLGLSPQDTGSEAGFIRLIYAGGILNLVLFLIFSIISIRNLNKKCNEENSHPIYIGMLFYQCALLASMINLPLQYSFTNVGLFTAFFAVSILNRRIEVESIALLDSDEDINIYYDEANDEILLCDNA